MSETVKLILSLSVSGGLFALVLFSLKPFMRNRLSKSFQYYIWIVVLLRFILPFSFGINLMDYTFNTPNTPQAEEEMVIPNNNPAVNNNVVNNNEPIITEQQPPTPVSTDSAKPSDVIRTLSDNLLWIWLSGFVLSATFNILGYLRFIRYVHGAAYAVEIPDCTAAVYKSRFAPTPMLVGVIKPRIYLPDIEYSDEQLKNILLHELTHLRRRDVWLKWFVSLVVSVHWFNPIVYFMRREINRACEMSCDEAVIRNLDSVAKQSYGDTLISVVAESRYPVGVMSTTMCEEKKKLKERLIAIMNCKKKTKITVLITVFLAVMLTCSAFAFGAGTTGGFAANKPQSDTPNPDENQKLEMLAADTNEILLTIEDNQKIYEHIVNLHMDKWEYDAPIPAEATGIYRFIGYEERDGALTAVSEYVLYVDGSGYYLYSKLLLETYAPALTAKLPVTVGEYLMGLSDYKPSMRVRPPEFTGQEGESTDNISNQTAAENYLASLAEIDFDGMVAASSRRRVEIIDKNRKKVYSITENEQILEFHQNLKYSEWQTTDSVPEEAGMICNIVWYAQSRVNSRELTEQYRDVLYLHEGRYYLKCYIADNGMGNKALDLYVFEIPANVAEMLIALIS